MSLPDPQPQPLQSPSAEFSSFALFDLVRSWYFQKHDLVLSAFDDTIQNMNGAPDVRTIWKMRAHCITLFKALRQKIVRQETSGKLSNEEKALVKQVTEILKKPAEKDIAEGKTQLEQLNFWNRVIDLEINILDLVGITKIDTEKKDAMERYMKGMYNG